MVFIFSIILLGIDVEKNINQDDRILKPIPLNY